MPATPAQWVRYNTRSRSPIQATAAEPRCPDLIIAPHVVQLRGSRIFNTFDPEV